MDRRGEDTSAAIGSSVAAPPPSAVHVSWNDRSTYAGPGKSQDAPYHQMEDGAAYGGADGGDADDHDDASTYALSYAPSILSSVMTAEGLADARGFSIVCLVVLVGDMSRGIFFPTLWPLVQSLGGNTVTLGYAVASFSFGRVLVSPLFGSWSVTHGYKSTLLISCSILWVGALLYAQVPTVGRNEFLILAQMVLGVGSGTLGVTRAYVAETTPTRDRTTYIAWLSAVEYMGFAGTPFLGSLFSRLFEDETMVVEWGPFRLDAYTAPGYFLMIMVAITLGLLVFAFQDRQRSKSATSSTSKIAKSKKRSAIDDLANQKTIFGLTTINALMVGCMLLNVATKGCISSFETLGITLAEFHFGIDNARAGTIVAVCGFLGVISLLCMGYIAMVLTDIQMIVGGIVVMIVGISSLTGIDESAGDNSTWIYCVAIFMIYSIGYSIGHAAVIGLFSKIVGRQPQGTLLGWFSVAGSLARICFPLMSGYVVYYRDVSTLCFILIGVLALAVFFVLFNRECLSKLST